MVTIATLTAVTMVAAGLAGGRYTVDFVGSQFNGPGSLGDHDHEGHPGWRIDQIGANITDADVLVSTIIPLANSGQESAARTFNAAIPGIVRSKEPWQARPPDRHEQQADHLRRHRRLSGQRRAGADLGLQRPEQPAAPAVTALWARPRLCALLREERGRARSRHSMGA